MDRDEMRYGLVKHYLGVGYSGGDAVIGADAILNAMDVPQEVNEATKKLLHREGAELLRVALTREYLPPNIIHIEQSVRQYGPHAYIDPKELSALIERMFK